MNQSADGSHRSKVGRKNTGANYTNVTSNKFRRTYWPGWSGWERSAAPRPPVHKNWTLPPTPRCRAHHRGFKTPFPLPPSSSPRRPEAKLDSVLIKSPFSWQVVGDVASTWHPGKSVQEELYSLIIISLSFSTAVFISPAPPCLLPYVLSSEKISVFIAPSIL